jgi:beta-glucosidase
MTLEEKAAFCAGKNFWHLNNLDRLGIPSLMITDGPHGLRKQSSSGEQIGLADSVPATCFPTASALAASWNRDLLYEIGTALGEECRQEKVAVLLGPGVNIKRSPLCGRNFEYFSEDPFLTGELAASWIQGVQSQGIGTSLKHYAVNNQETRRMSINAVVDERTLREIYLPGFEAAVREAQPWTVMAAYNQVNGRYCCEHEQLIGNILREEWGYDGVVVSDWGAVNERVSGLKAGLDLEMPGLDNGNQARIVSAVQSGELEEATLDAAVERLLALIFRARETLSRDWHYDQEAHHALARRAAGEGAVLLKNESRVLPLNSTETIALIGRFARHPRYQGAGSSLIHPTRLDNLYEELIRLTGPERVSYAPGYTENGDLADDDLIQKALQTAREADTVVVCAGLPSLYETEGVDREHLQLPPGHNALIEALAADHPRVVVVLSSGAPVEMPWIDRVPTVLQGYLGGQAGGGALADILTGAVNPSGKLAETFPLRLEDTPAYHYFPGGPQAVEYRESLYVGYRYYDTAGVPVLFPFGHGLSYTSFAYSRLELSCLEIQAGERLTVRLRVKNSGSASGKEIVQVYLRDPESTPFRPRKELKAFTKVDLQPGEEREVSVTLDSRAFAAYDSRLSGWQIEGGRFEILIGSSSQDIRLRENLIVRSPADIPAYDREALASYYQLSQEAFFSPEAFAALLGREVPEHQAPERGEYTLNTPVMDMQDSLVGRLLFRMMESQVEKIIAGQEESPNALMIRTMIREMPLRGILMQGQGPLNRNRLEALLLLLNGRVFKGLRRLVTGAGDL